MRTSENGTWRRNTVALAVMVSVAGLLAVSLRQGTGQTVPPQKAEFPALKPVVVIKRGQTSTVQWAWEPHNGRAEQWYLLKDATTPNEDDVDHLRSQPKLDIDGVHIEADHDQSNHLGEELFKAGAYTEEQRRNGNIFVTGAVLRAAVSRNATLGGRTIYVHNISGTGFPAQFRLRAELHIIVTR